MVFSVNQARSCHVSVLVGSSVQIGNFNSKRILLKIVKSLEIRRKFGNCKLNFARFLVRSTTPFVIFT
jgi:hypothetical protein